MFSNQNLSVILCFCTLLLFGCGDLTFENPGNVDFERYSSVYVAPIQVEADPAVDLVRVDDMHRYLTSELAKHSGFAYVSSTFESNSDSDLYVTIDIDADYDFDEDTTTYSIYVGFGLFDAVGIKVVSSDETTRGNDLESTVEETLDKVVHYFLRPYRI